MIFACENFMIDPHSSEVNPRSAPNMPLLIYELISYHLPGHTVTYRCLNRAEIGWKSISEVTTHQILV